MSIASLDLIDLILVLMGIWVVIERVISVIAWVQKKLGKKKEEDPEEPQPPQPLDGPPRQPATTGSPGRVSATARPRRLAGSPVYLSSGSGVKHWHSKPDCAGLRFATTEIKSYSACSLCACAGGSPPGGT